MENVVKNLVTNFPKSFQPTPSKSSRKAFRFSVLMLGLLAQTACLGALPDGSGSGGGGNAPYSGGGAGIPAAGGGVGDSPQSSPPSTPVVRDFQTDVLLFGGTGTWDEEVSALEDLFQRQNVSYRLVSSGELDEMSVEEIERHGLVLFPGGYGGRQTSSLASGTQARLRTAVQERGVGYVGFCAGAFMAVAPQPAPGEDAIYGLGIVKGSVLDYYFKENQGIEASIEEHRFADGRSRDILWYGGPVTLDLPGGVVARYSNGDPAISQVWSGRGMVVLAATHPVVRTGVKEDFGLEDPDGPDTVSYTHLTLPTKA